MVKKFSLHCHIQPSMQSVSVSFPGDKAVGEWSWPLICTQYRCW